MKYAIFDTNIYLHFLYFEEAAWLSTLGTDQLTILIPPLVLHELDKHAEAHKSNRVRRLSERVLKRFRELIVGGQQNELGIIVPVNSALTVCFLKSEPQINFTVHQLLPDRQDDQLLASFIEVAAALRSRPVLVSNDSAILVKAMARGFEMITPPFELGLPVELAEADLKIQKLENELRRVSVSYPSDETRIHGGKDI